MKRTRSLIAAAVVSGLFAGGASFAGEAMWIDVLSVRLQDDKLVLGLEDEKRWTPTDGVYHNEEGDRITIRSGGVIAWQPSGQSTKDKVTAMKVEEGSKILLTTDGGENWIQMPDGLWEHKETTPKLRVKAGKVVSLQERTNS